MDPDVETDREEGQEPGESSGESLVPPSGEHSLFTPLHTLILVVGILVVGLIAFVLYKVLTIEPAPVDTDTSAEVVTELPIASESPQETQTEVSDVVSEATDNPIEDAPDINPVGNTNPFNDSYTNPFE